MRFRSNQQFIGRRQGFTLIETLISISILALVAGAVFTAAQAGLQASSMSQDRITAFYMAQEIIEDVKTLREVNQAASNWLEDFGGKCQAPSDSSPSRWCVVDKFNDGRLKDEPAFELCGDAPGQSQDFNKCPPVQSDGARFDYELDGSDGWSETKFRRAITLSQTGSAGGGSDNVAELTARIEWRDVRGRTQSIEVVDYIYDWK